MKATMSTNNPNPMSFASKVFQATKEHRKHKLLIKVYCAFCASSWLYDKVRCNSKRCEFRRILIDFSRESMWHLSCCLSVDATLSPSRAREVG
jgi:hypothetical protein